MTIFSVGVVWNGVRVVGEPGGVDMGACLEVVDVNTHLEARSGQCSECSLHGGSGPHHKVKPEGT